MEATEVTDWYGAMIRASQRLGIEGVFLRVMAAEFPDQALGPLAFRFEPDGEVVVRARHACGPYCPATAGDCLTAMKLEETVARRWGRPYRLTVVVPVAGGVEAHLRPLV